MSGDARRERHPDAPAGAMALVAAVDSKLRLALFERLAELGWRVDAVGDVQGVIRRLEKDVYDLVVTDAFEIPPVPEITRVVQIDAEMARDREAWTALLDPPTN